MEWIFAHGALTLAVFSAASGMIAVFVKVPDPIEVPFRKALLIFALVALVSAGLVSFGPTLPSTASAVTPTPMTLVSASTSPSPIPSSSSSAPSAIGRQWLHDPGVNTPVGGLPGFIETVIHNEKDGDPSQTLLSLSLDANEILVISGNWAIFPNPEVGTVGLKTNCYMVIARGPMTWTSRPEAGEFPPITLPSTTMAGWHVDRVDAMAETQVWTNEWVASLAKEGVDRGPCTKGANPQTNSYPSVDLWELP